MVAKNKNKRADEGNPQDSDDDLIGNDDATATFEALNPDTLVDDIHSEAAGDLEAPTAELEEGISSNESAAGSARPMAGLPTIQSLARLEDDLARLQQSWADVEQQLAAKDSEIAYLNDEREVHIAAFRSLQSDLDEQLDEHDRQQDAIAALEKRLADAEASLASHNEIVSERDAHIAQLDAAAAEAMERQAALQDECDSLQAKIAAVKAESAKLADEKGQVEARVGVLKTDLQALEAYIDRRKVEWDALNKKLDDYKATLSGMQDELEARDEIIASHDKATVGLESKINELRQRCAELDGRRAERELANRELNDLLAEKARELQMLRKERDDACEGSKAMVSRIQDQQARINALETEVSEMSCRVKDIRKKADSQCEKTQREARDQISDYAQKLESAQAQASRSSKAAEHAEKRLADAEVEIARRDESLTLLRDANNLLEGRLIDESNRVSEISDELGEARRAEKRLRAEYEAFQTDAEQRLEANSELIAKLETELEARTAVIELLEKNADKLGAINHDIQALDRRIVAGVQDSERRLSAMTGRSLTLAVEGMPRVRFPIYKSCMTIGRSSDSDIQLRRKFISRLHARVTEDAGGVRIEDLGSKNGLYVNAEPVKESYLHDGDIVDIGEVQLRYVEDEQAA